MSSAEGRTGVGNLSSFPEKFLERFERERIVLQGGSNVSDDPQPGSKIQHLPRA